jgi:hypothetical protein
MNRADIIKKLYAAIDNDPYEWVDITPIVESYYEDWMNTQQKAHSVRAKFNSVIHEMSKKEDIELNQLASQSLNTTMGNEFLPIPIEIRGTLEYYEKIKTKKDAQIVIHGDNFGQVNTSKSYQSLDNSSFSLKNAALTNMPNKRETRRSFSSIILWIVSIIAGIATIWEFLLKRYFNSP